MEILKQFDNRLLNRVEAVVTLEADVTPSKEDVGKKISEKFSKPVENVVVESIKGKFGSHKFTIEVKVYDDAESLVKYETVSQKERKKKLEDEKKAAEEAKKAKEETAKAAASSSEEVGKSEETAPEKEPQEDKKEVEEASKPDEEPKIEEIPKEEGS
jgi:ribosomal protein S24E